VVILLPGVDFLSGAERLFRDLPEFRAVRRRSLRQEKRLGPEDAARNAEALIRAGADATRNDRLLWPSAPRVTALAADKLSLISDAKWELCQAFVDTSELDHGRESTFIAERSCAPRRERLSGCGRRPRGRVASLGAGCGAARRETPEDHEESAQHH